LLRFSLDTVPGETTLLTPVAETDAATSRPQALLEKGAIDLELRGRRYRARWASPASVEHLRVNVRVEAGTNGSAKVHVETLDLYSPRSRQSFAVRAGRIFGTSGDAFEDDLSELLLAVDHAQRSAASNATAAELAANAPPAMTDLERKQALDLLRAPDLMDRIARDMELVGYVGEDNNKKLGYLIAVSRKLADPLSAIIISQSGAGKSGLTGAVERLVPPEELVFWSRLTPQALYYVEKDFLKRKLVVIEERAGSDAADYSIRALQSKQKLVQAVPIKDPATGVIRTRTMEVEGPAAFLETTTRLQINPENASRCFELYLDESMAQTARVQDAQRTAKTLDGLRLRERGRVIEHMHQNAQRLLDSVAVVVPYAPLLTFPATWLRTRRDNLRLLNLIEAVAFLHQMQRPRLRLPSGADYIEATVEDYAIAYALASSVLGFGLDELRKPARDLLAVLETKLRTLAQERGLPATKVQFTRREVREWAGLPQHQVKHAMHELEELEYVHFDRSPRGSRYSYQLVDDAERKRSPMAGLLTPGELFNRIGEAEAAEKRAAKVEQSGKNGRSTTKPKRF